MSLLKTLANVSFAAIEKAFNAAYKTELYPEPFHTDMTMKYDVVHYIKEGIYMGSRQIPLQLGEANEAQQHKPDCVMWRDTSGGWVWWYHDGTINHWRLAHPEVQAVPEILKMMKLTGAL